MERKRECFPLFLWLLCGESKAKQSNAKRKEFNDMKSDVFLLAEGSSCFLH